MPRFSGTHRWALITIPAPRIRDVVFFRQKKSTQVWSISDSFTHKQSIYAISITHFLQHQLKPNYDKWWSMMVQSVAATITILTYILQLMFTELYPVVAWLCECDTCLRQLAGLCVGLGDFGYVSALCVTCNLIIFHNNVYIYIYDRGLVVKPWNPSCRLYRYVVSFFEYPFNLVWGTVTFSSFTTICATITYSRFTFIDRHFITFINRLRNHHFFTFHDCLQKYYFSRQCAHQSLIYLLCAGPPTSHCFKQMSWQAPCPNRCGGWCETPWTKCLLTTNGVKSTEWGGSSFLPLQCETPKERSDIYPLQCEGHGTWWIVFHYSAVSTAQSGLFHFGGQWRNTTSFAPCATPKPADGRSLPNGCSVLFHVWMHPMVSNGTKLPSSPKTGTMVAVKKAPVRAWLFCPNGGTTVSKLEPGWQSKKAPLRALPSCPNWWSSQGIKTGTKGDRQKSICQGMTILSTKHFSWHCLPVWEDPNGGTIVWTRCFWPALRGIIGRCNIKSCGVAQLFCLHAEPDWTDT